jgi:hypothetical protein
VGCLRFSQLLWALKGVYGPTLVAVTGGLYPLSLLPHSGITLSPGGLKTPSTLHSRSGSTAGRLPTLFGATQPLSPTLQHARGPRKGGRSQSAFNLRTSCAHLGLAHHHTPPQRLAVLTPSIFTRGTTETDAHTFYPHCLSFPGQLPTPLFILSIPLPFQHNSISSLLLTFL